MLDFNPNHVAKQPYHCQQPCENQIAKSINTIEL